MKQAEPGKHRKLPVPADQALELTTGPVGELQIQLLHPEDPGIGQDPALVDFGLLLHGRARERKRVHSLPSNRLAIPLRVMDHLDGMAHWEQR